MEDITAAFYLSNIAPVPYPKEYVLDMILPEIVWFGGPVGN
jgi:hypothetical protein